MGKGICGSCSQLVELFIASQSSTSSTRYDWELLCDHETGAPVFVRWSYDTDGAINGSAAFNPNGTAYVGSISTLVSCQAEAGPTRFDWEVLCAPVTAAPVFVRWSYNIDGTVNGSAAFNVDGTAYVGEIDELISCEEAAIVEVEAEARELTAQNYTTLTNATETSILAAGAAGIFHDLKALIIDNTTDTEVTIQIRDATAGSVRTSFTVPPFETRGVAFTQLFRQTTAASAWTAQNTVNISGVNITIQALKQTA